MVLSVTSDHAVTVHRSGAALITAAAHTPQLVSFRGFLTRRNSLQIELEPHRGRFLLPKGKNELLRSETSNRGPMQPRRSPSSQSLVQIITHHVSDRTHTHTHTDLPHFLLLPPSIQQMSSHSPPSELHTIHTHTPVLQFWSSLDFIKIPV